MIGFEHGVKGPLSLYIHIPFCTARCRYCDFASNVAGEEAMARYTDALLAELDARAETLRGAEVATVFFGGGTPGLMPPVLLEKICGRIHALFSCRDGGEWTLESNPEVTHADAARAWLAMGFNRLSLGLQSADPALLAMLGRRAGPERFLQAAEDVCRAGFENLNADLMASLPGQTAKDLEDGIRTALRGGAQHISLYSLVVHDETPLGRDILSGKLRQPGDDEDRDMFAAVCRLLETEGFNRYEISNFARPGRESRHNLVYWEGGPYLGLGTAAASFDGRQRWTNTASLEEYCHAMEAGSSPETETELLTEKERVFERFMLGLRLTRGIDLEILAAEYSYRPDERTRALFARWRDAGLASYDGRLLALTPWGLDVQNALLEDLMECMEL